ncbi:bifunctional hydroxymethylpyrimidine kinase/phosphomethylpyrimidine kinase [Candidatus Poribacteria bacterium]|nr:bifunctional hydroxymethylpyrimidine kinase/phosphomethylpyrimidine kinase [Candidatus Poribacteria bacterium]
MVGVLTIAGSDSGGGAGIQADIKAISANGGYAMSVITSVTAQNTCEVRLAYDLPTEVIRAQLDAVFDDLPVDAVKTGMLSSSEIVETVAECLAVRSVERLVVDPVMVSKSGFKLLHDDAVEAVKERLLPLALVVTPNIPEAELLAELPIRSADDAGKAARAITRYGCRAVIVKGGHAEDDESARDVLFDGHETHVIVGPRYATKSTHGTGCTFSAALATRLASGTPLFDAARAAKQYVAGAIRHAPSIGKGHGPTNHFWRFLP